MIRFGYVAVNGVRLHLAESGFGDAPLLFLLHGFPEFWFGWREYIQPLAELGFHVVAPDQRGYDLSSKPRGTAAYRLDALAGDILALADHFGQAEFQVVGHDWGATVGWWLATTAPGRLRRLVAINAPHPAVWRQAIRQDPEQRRRSQYVQLLRIRWLPEFLIRLQRYSALAKAFESCTRPEASTPAILEQYYEAWHRRHALHAMLNWYRALFRQPLVMPAPGSLRTKTLVLWGDRDPYAHADLAEQSAALCAEAAVRHVPEATHWLIHDAPDLVREAIGGFLDRRGVPAS